MSMSKVMKKNDWLEIANGSFNLGLLDSETVDNIVLKIANELNIKTDSVKITELKKNVVTEIEVRNQRSSENIENSENNEVSEKTSTEIIEEEIKEEPKIVYSELDNLRAECIMYGVGYGEKHKVNDLTQLLGQIRGIVPASMTLEEALRQLNPAPASETTENMDANNFELTLDNADIIQQIAPESKTSVSIQVETKKVAIPVATIKSNLEVYRGTFTQTIRGHFRPQTISEIKSLFNHDYPFTHEIKVNPKNRLQIEIIFTQNDVNVRVPSDNLNDWIEIRE